MVYTKGEAVWRRLTGGRSMSKANGEGIMVKANVEGVRQLS